MLPSSTLLHQKEEGRGGRIDQPHLRTTHLTAIVGGQQFGHFNPLGRTFGMTRIDGNKQTAALFEQFAQLKNTLAAAEAEWEEAMMELEG